jgi:ribosome-binding factor A
LKPSAWLSSAPPKSNVFIIEPSNVAAFVFVAQMEYQRSDRVGDRLLEEIAELLRREIHDPRLQCLNLTGVRMSKDLRHAKVFFSLLGGSGDREQALAGLKSASGFIRSRLAKKLNLRFVPSIDFLYDDSEDEARRIDALLDKVRE